MAAPLSSNTPRSPLSCSLSGRYLQPRGLLMTARWRRPQRPGALRVLEHVSPPPDDAQSRTVCAPLLMSQAAVAYCTLSRRVARPGEKHETCPSPASGYNRDRRSPLHRHLCAQQQHSILITQTPSPCHSPSRGEEENNFPRHVLKIKQRCTCSEC